MKKFFKGLFLIGMGALLCTGCGGAEPAEATDTAMGTVIRQKIYGGDKEGMEENQRLLEEMERDLLSWRLETSEIYRINETAGSPEGVVVSEKLSPILSECLALSEKSEGAFDITIGGVTRLWNLDVWAASENQDAFEVPEEAAIRAALENCGSGKLHWEEEKSLLYLPEKMSLDLGAVGKGIALDGLLEKLQANKKVGGAVISVGGSVLVYGEKPDGSSFRIGIVNPFQPSEYLGTLELKGGWCVSTSGDYERYVEKDGKRYHHIINPDTGYPAESGLCSVTVLSGSGFLSDALSTACFVLGSERGKALAESYGAEAVFVEKDGRISMTAGMDKYCVEIKNKVQ